MSEMKTKVMLHDVNEAKELVNAASKCDFDVDIFYNRIIIDAKSLLGVLSMDLRNPMTVQAYGQNDEFNKTLQRFAIA